MSFEVKSNLAKVLSDQAKIRDSLVEMMAEKVAETTDEALSEIVSNWPSDTGTSAAAWSGEADGMSAKIGNSADYATYINDGAAAEESEAIFVENFEALAEQIEAETTEMLEG